MNIWNHGRQSENIHKVYLTLGAFCDSLPAPVAMVTLHYEAARFEPFDYTAMIKTLGGETEGGGSEGGVLFSRAEVDFIYKP